MKWIKVSERLPGWDGHFICKIRNGLGEIYKKEVELFGGRWVVENEEDDVIEWLEEDEEETKILPPSIITIIERLPIKEKRENKLFRVVGDTGLELGQLMCLQGVDHFVFMPLFTEPRVFSFEMLDIISEHLKLLNQ